MSSFRISKELSVQLDKDVGRLKRGKNAITQEALQKHLHRQHRFLEEARRQSILASAVMSEDDVWLDHSDPRGWR